MEDWKKTKCGTCIFQRGKPICNSCSGYRFYRPMSNADRIRSMNDEELAEFLVNFKNTFGEEYEGKMSCLDWLQSEAE
jgi:hypothetical protein